MRLLRSVSTRQAFYSAVNTLVLQAVAVLALVPADYGLFSLYYLGFALGSSVTYSVVSEAWSRSSSLGDVPQSWARYCTALCTVSVLAALPILGFGFFSGAMGLSLILAGAVMMATYRVGARFYSVATGNSWKVGPADLIGAGVFLASYFSLHFLVSSLESVATAWLLSTLASILWSERPRIDVRFGFSGWIRGHKSTIRVLLLDSTLMDLSSIGVPLVLAPFLGITNFGIYRGVSSAALPVRLVLNPIRPLLGLRKIQFFGRPRVVALAIGTGTGMGAVIFVCLQIVRSQVLFPGTVVYELAGFAMPVSIFVACNFIGMLYYLISRSHLPGGRLLAYRSVQMLGSIGFPLGGFALADLSGSIWGFALNSVVNAIFVTGLVILEARRRDREWAAQNMLNPTSIGE